MDLRPQLTFQVPISMYKHFHHCYTSHTSRIQSTPLIKDTLVPAPLSFIEGVSSTEGFWSSSSYMPLYHHLGTSEAELILSEGMRPCIC